MRLRLLATLLLASTGLNCRREAAPDATPPVRESLRSELVGCYRLDAPDRAAPGLSWLRTPQAFALDSAVAGRGPQFRALRLAPTDSTIAPDAFWTADSLTDTVRVHLTTGLSGLTLVFSASSKDTLQGALFTWADAGPSDWREGDAIAIRASCADFFPAAG